MDIEQYVFSQSYLKNAAFDLRSGDLIMEIDAYISMEHPGLNGIFDDGEDCDFDLFYRMIQMRFSGVQYFELIRADLYGQALENDRGCIEHIQIMDAFALGQAIAYDPDLGRLDLALNPSLAPMACLSRNCEPLEIVYFKSSVLSFLIGYDGLEITEL